MSTAVKVLGVLLLNVAFNSTPAGPAGRLASALVAVFRRKPAAKVLGGKVAEVTMFDAIISAESVCTAASIAAALPYVAPLPASAPVAHSLVPGVVLKVCTAPISIAACAELASHTHPIIVTTAITKNALALFISCLPCFAFWPFCPD